LCCSTYAELLTDLFLRRGALKSRDRADLVICQFPPDRFAQPGAIGMAMVFTPRQVLQVLEAVVVLVTADVVHVSAICLPEECRGNESMHASCEVLAISAGAYHEVAGPRMRSLPKHFP